jgi:multidrug transporter EmrE-like cation transporter
MRAEIVPLPRQDRIFLAVFALVALYPAGWLLYFIIAAIPFPYALDYNEGIVWQQMNDILAGHGYAPINGFPAIVYHYPPVYHLTSATVAALGIDPLSAGRIVSLLATMGSTLLVVLLTRPWLETGYSKGQRIAGMAGAAVCLLGCKGVQDWAPLMRVDPLACFFALLGLWLAICAVERPRLVYWASIAFVLSVFTKQNSVLTAAAGLGALFFYRPSLAIRGILTCIALGIAVLTLLIWLTHGEVLKHLVLYNINRFDLSRLMPNILEATEVRDRVLLAMDIVGVIWISVHARHSPSPGGAKALTNRHATIILLALSTIYLVSTAKFGSSSAYYMQWEAAFAVFGGVAIAAFMQKGQNLFQKDRNLAGFVCLMVPLLAILTAAVTTGPSHLRLIREFREQGDQLAEVIRPLHGDILSTEMVLLLRTGHRVVWEPAIFRELAIAGRWDESILIKRIKSHQIAAVLSDGDRGYRWFDEQFSPKIVNAMDGALPRKIHFGLRILHLPAQKAANISRTPMPSALQTSRAE